MMSEVAAQHEIFGELVNTYKTGKVVVDTVGFLSSSRKELGLQFFSLGADGVLCAVRKEEGAKALTSWKAIYLSSTLKPAFIRIVAATTGNLASGEPASAIAAEDARVYLTTDFSEKPKCDRWRFVGKKDNVEVSSLTVGQALGRKLATVRIWTKATNNQSSEQLPLFLTRVNTAGVETPDWRPYGPRLQP